MFVLGSHREIPDITDAHVQRVCLLKWLRTHTSGNEQPLGSGCSRSVEGWEQPLDSDGLAVFSDQSGRSSGSRDGIYSESISRSWCGSVISSGPAIILRILQNGALRIDCSLLKT